MAVSLALATPLVASGRSRDDATAVALANRARASAGVQSLRRADVLEALAKGHNERMAGSGRIHHNDALPSQLSATGVRWVVAGENVGVGPSVLDVHDGFMASATHRDNVLSSGYNAVGIAVTNARGRVYVTQVFALLRVEPQPAREAAVTNGSCVVRTAEDGTHVPASFYGLPC